MKVALCSILLLALLGSVGGMLAPLVYFGINVAGYDGTALNWTGSHLGLGNSRQVNATLAAFYQKNGALVDVMLRRAIDTLGGGEVGFFATMSDQHIAAFCHVVTHHELMFVPKIAQTLEVQVGPQFEQNVRDLIDSRAITDKVEIEAMSTFFHNIEARTRGGRQRDQSTALPAHRARRDRALRPRRGRTTVKATRKG